jgi:hypothetical protein
VIALFAFLKTIFYFFYLLDSSYLFIDENKITPEVREYLHSNRVSILPYEEIFTFVETLHLENKKLWYDSNTLNGAVFR